MRVWIETMRRATPGEKLKAVFEASEFAFAMAKAGVRSMYPGAPEEQVLLRTAARYLSREIMIKAYGWDPESDEPPRRRRRAHL
jgi:hypothetical protein